MRTFYKILLNHFGKGLPDPGECGGKFKWCQKARNRWARKIAPQISRRANICRGAKICGSGSNLIVEDNASIGINCQVGSDLRIGARTMMGPNCILLTENHYYDRETHTFKGYINKQINIGADCWIGNNVIILPGAIIGDHCIIGAGAVVPGKRFPSYCLIVGNPAVVKKSLE